MAGSNKFPEAAQAEIMTEPADAAMSRAGVSQSTTAPWTLEDDVRAYRAGGWAAIGVWLNKLERPVMDEFWFPEEELEPATVDRAAAVTAGLTVSHVLVGGRFTEGDDVRRQRVEHAVGAAVAARQLKAGCLVVIPGRLNGLARARAVDLAASSLSEVLERSPDVRLAIEPVKEVDFVTTLDEALDLADLIDNPRLGVYPDAFHLWRDDGIHDSIARASERIFGVHLADGSGRDGDRQRLPPGEGTLPLVEFVAAIEATGYAGTYDVELFSMGSSPEDAAALLERCATGMRDLVPSQPVAS